MIGTRYSPPRPASDGGFRPLAGLQFGVEPAPFGRVFELLSEGTHLKILQAMRKQARRTKARKVDSRLSCRTVNLRNPPFRHPKNRSTLLRAFRRRNARFPPRIPFPRRGFFGMPARIPRRRNPSRIAFASSAASAYTPFGRVRARPLPLFFTRRPPSASSNRRQSCSFPGPTTTFKGSPSSFTKTCTLVPFRFLCPSIPTPSPLFSPPPAWNRSPPPPPSPSPAYTPSPEGLAGSFARPPFPEVPETAAGRSDRRHMGGAYRTTDSR
jgi:hypothetical protein